MPTRLPLLLPLAVLLVACHGRVTRLPATTTKTIAEARQAPIESYPWPEYVTGEDRIRIEDYLETIFNVGGRDGMDAEARLVAMDEDADATEFRMVGRVVSEMKTVIDKYGVQEYEGKSRIMVLDRILRKIDGVQERMFGEEYGLDLDESAARAMRLVHVWNWWYREGRFLKRYKPWDPRVDMFDEDGTEDPDLKPID